MNMMMIMVIEQWGAESITYVTTLDKTWKEVEGERKKEK